MKVQQGPAPVITRREPKTQRGRETRDDIKAAARKLASDQWVDDVPFTELATAAGVARASLLHAYPHWQNILWDLFEDESECWQQAYADAIALKRARPSDRAYAMLASILDRAESAGRLYANLRSAMFTWRGKASDEALSAVSVELPLSREVLAEFARIVLGEHYRAIEELLGITRDGALKPNEVAPAPVGECLMNFAFDLAAGSPTHFATFEERRKTLRACVDVTAAGVRKSPQRGVKRRRS